MTKLSCNMPTIIFAEDKHSPLSISFSYHMKAKSNDNKIAENECLSLFMSGGSAAGHPRGGGLASATYGRYMYLSVCFGL